ncbi:ribonuclease H-like domain-containing protein [Tanacetum coccineum]
MEGVMTEMPITTAEEKAQRRLEVKARSTLMMGIPNEHQLMFNFIKDAKKLLEVVKKRFGGNATTRKTQRNLLKSLSPEWKTHAVVWRNKADLDTMSMDDLYNNLKVYEQEVKGMSSSSSRTQNMAFVSSSNNNTRSTNEAVNTAEFLLHALNPQLVHEHLQQIHPDDMEEIDLRWQMAMLTMRARRFLKNTGMKLTVNGNETISFIKSKSDQAEEGPNYALMVFSSLSPDSEVSNDSICSKSCLEIVELLKSQNDQLLKDLKKSKLMVLGYKTGLESVEEKLEVYKANESIYLQDIKGLNFEIHIGEITIRELRKKLEIVQKEKDGIQLNVDKFEHASKSLNKLIECQIVDNCKKGLGYENYNAVPPPYTGNFMPPTPDLSFTGLDEFVNEPVVENCKAMSSEEEPKVVRKNDDAPIIKEWVSDDEEEDVSQPKTEKKIVRPSIVKKEFVKSKQQEKTARKTVKQVEQHRQNTHSPRGNQRNWNNMMSQKLGSNFEMFNKACYVCGSFDHLQVDCNYHQKQFQNQRMVKCFGTILKSVVNHQNFAKKTHPCAKKNLVPRAVLMKSGLVSVNTARQGNPQMDLQDQGVIDSGCSRHMTGNMSYLTDYEEIDGGYVAFRGNPKGGKITGKCTIKTARTPQQTRVAERKNMTLIEAARTMLADLKLPTTFWAEAVNTACYVQNRVLVVKPHNKTPYELFHGRTPTLSFMRPFGCPVTILNTIDHLGKFDGKADEVFFVGYSLNRKAFRVFNIRTRIVEKNSNIRFSESTPNAIGTKASDNAGQARKETEPVKDYILLPLWIVDPPFSQDPKSSHDDGFKPSTNDEKKVNEDPRKDSKCKDQEKEDNEEPKKVIHALKDPSWIVAMQEELLQFKLQEVWTIVDLPNGKKAIGSK